MARPGEVGVQNICDENVHVDPLIPANFGEFGLDCCNINFSRWILIVSCRRGTKRHHHHHTPLYSQSYFSWSQSQTFSVILIDETLSLASPASSMTPMYIYWSKRYRTRKWENHHGCAITIITSVCLIVSVAVVITSTIINKRIYRIRSMEAMLIRQI